MRKLARNILLPFLFSLSIFLISAGISIWAAPKKDIAWTQFTLLLFGVILMFLIAFIGRRAPETGLGIIGALFSLFAVAAVFQFLLTVNWVEDGPNVPGIRQIGTIIHNLTPGLSEAQNLHKNLVGGLLVILIPLSIIGLIWAWKRRLWPVIVPLMLAIDLSLLGLIMSVSRGAWLGFLFGWLFAGYFYWRIQQRGVKAPVRLLDGLVIVVLLFCVSWNWLMLSMPSVTAPLEVIAIDSGINRVNLWRDSLTLVQDYRFTGIGLGNATMVYSSYIFLLHVPFLPHSHNLFMEIAIEQGLLGMIAFIGMVLTAGWAVIRGCKRRSKEIQLYGAAVVASLAGMLIHGVVEAGIYAHQTIPFILAPLAFALALWLSHPEKRKVTRSAPSRFFALALIAFPIISILLLIIWPGSQAALQANLGAVSQTQAELAVYQWPEWPLQDELRRAEEVDLATALKYYHAAIEIDPTNVTAHRRLGQYALSIGDYDMAQAHLEEAYLFAPDQRPTRQMLGEVYALQGKPEEAVALWQDVDTANGQLDARKWWYDNRETAELAARFDAAVALLKQQ